ncbi:MAG TPA: cation:proton antiporter [Firmicutes bacterium]|jgi:multicomponent Na+:H+ antiporter subunit F|nr:cation:proton antiporter [Bacillota bacterium]
MSVVLIVIILIGVFALLDFVRAVKGPTAVDRLVASSAISTKGMAVILLLAYVNDNMSYIDVALVLALCGFVGLLAMLRSLLPEDADILTKDLVDRPAQLVHFIGAEEEK